MSLQQRIIKGRTRTSLPIRPQAAMMPVRLLIRIRSRSPHLLERRISHRHRTTAFTRRSRMNSGVTLNMEFLVGDLQQKLGVMIAGGDYPDLITADTKLVAAKAVIPLEDLIKKYAPKLKEHYAAYWNRMKDPSDGHITGFRTTALIRVKFIITGMVGRLSDSEGHPERSRLSDTKNTRRLYDSDQRLCSQNIQLSTGSLLSGSLRLHSIGERSACLTRQSI